MTTQSTLAAVFAAAVMFNACALLGAQTSPAEAPAPAVPGQMSNPAPDALAEVADDAEKPTPWTERGSLFIEHNLPSSVSDVGFTPYVSWAGEQWSNFSGGTETGTMWDSLVTFGFEQDLSKLFKKEKAGTLGMSVFWYQGSKDFGDYLSSMSSPSNIFASDMVRIFEIYYANEFDVADGVVSFRVGQLATDEDFMGLDYADIFLNSNFGAMPANAGMALANGDTAFGQYATATFGVVAAYSINDFVAQFGVYNGNAGQDTPGNHGFDYELQDVAFWYQFQQNYKLAGLDGLVVLGGNYHSGDFADYNTGSTESGFYSFYLSMQQDLVANDEGEAILGGFVRAAWAPQSEIADITTYVDAGLNWFGPIPGRQDDILAFGVSMMHTGSGLRNSDPTVAGYETMLETTYKVQLTPAISIQPALQVYFNPANANTGERETAFVGGIRVEVNF